MACVNHQTKYSQLWGFIEFDMALPVHACMLNCIAFIPDKLVSHVEWEILMQEKFINGFNITEKGVLK